MNFIPEVIGHDKTKGQLKSMFEKGSVPQVLIFHGKKSIGKHLLARAFSKMLLQVEQSNPVDLVLYAAEKNGYTVKLIRAMLQELSLSPFEARSKVLILDDAERMLPVHFNALLKTLEELNPDTYVFFITSALQDILPTIRSRAAHLKCEDLNPQDIQNILKEQDASEIDPYLNDGSLERVLFFIQSGKQALTSVFACMEAILNQDASKIFMISEALEKAFGGDSNLFWNMWYALCRDLVLLNAKASEPCFFSAYSDQLVSWSQNWSLGLKEVAEAIEHAKEGMLYNLKFKVAIEYVALSLLEKIKAKSLSSELF